MYHHSSLGKAVSFLVSLLLALAGIVIGLHALSINVFESSFVTTNLSALVRPMQIAFGIAGVLGLVYLFTASGEEKYCRKCKSCEAPHSHQ